ncbi:MAG: ATP-dependent helicase UvrD/PcrA [Micromonosporaceae bacterium]|jgi:superfamily I DNA/RNA helicase|nr:ATP-dependent helicase UvrD/PcrA [Micromonosporaceae bacterium]
MPWRWQTDGTSLSMAQVRMEYVGCSVTNRSGAGPGRSFARRRSWTRGRWKGDPVIDWQRARGNLHGSAELEEIFSKARLLRLFRATDALAWALVDAWDGRNAYTDAAQAVRRVLANETLEAAQAEPVPVVLMNMHKSKGKEFDGVIIVEGQYSAALLDPTYWPTTSPSATTSAARKIW